MLQADEAGKVKRVAITPEQWEAASAAPVPRITAPPWFIREAPCFELDTQQSHSLAATLHQWTAVAERAARAAVGDGPAAPRRCTWPEIKRVLLAPALLAASHQSCSASHAVRYLGAIAARVHDTLLLTVRCKGQRQRQCIRSWARGLSVPTALQPQQPIVELCQRVRSIGELTIPQLRALKGDAESLSEQAELELKQQGRQRFVKWIQESAKHAPGALHRWCKQDSEVPARPFQSPGILGPDQRVASRAQWWANRWARDQPQQQATIRAIDGLRQAASQADQLPPITAQDVRLAVHSMSDKAGRGLDWWEPGAIKALPLPGLQGLADFYAATESTCLWAPQLACIAIALLPKPDPASDRPIALLPILCRLWSRCRKPYFTEWCVQHAGWWDTAVHGNSALQAALRRCIQDEAYRALGIVTAGVYWDLEKFYDDVAILALISRAVKLGYHPMPLALAMQLYLSHRVLPLTGQPALGSGHSTAS